MQQSLTSVKMTPDPPEETRPAQGWHRVWGVSVSPAADLDSPDSVLTSWVLAAVILIFILMGRHDMKWSSLTESCSGSHVRWWGLRIMTSQAEKTKTLNHERNCQHEFPPHHSKQKLNFNFPCFLGRCTLPRCPVTEVKLQLFVTHILIVFWWTHLIFCVQATGDSNVALAVRSHRTLELAGDNFYVITCGKSGWRDSATNESTTVSLSLTSGGRKIREATYGRDYQLRAEMDAPSGERMEIEAELRFLEFPFQINMESKFETVLPSVTRTALSDSSITTGKIITSKYFSITRY